MRDVIRVFCTGDHWCVGINGDDRFGRFRNPIAAIVYALDVVAERLDLPVVWPESLVIA